MFLVAYEIGYWLYRAIRYKTLKLRVRIRCFLRRY